MGSSGNFSFRDIVSDTLGYNYIVGSFDGIAVFDTISVDAITGFDIFIAKTDSLGNFLWVKSFDGTFDQGNKITLDINNNILITGCFQGTVDFDPSEDVVNKTASSGGSYILKLTTEGNFAWVKIVEEIKIRDIVTDKSDNIYLGGNFSTSSNNDFDPGNEVYKLNSQGLDDCFLEKLDENGNFIWAFSFGNSYRDHVYSLAIDSEDNLYATGKFVYDVDFDPGTGTHYLETINDQSDIFIMKISPNKELIWAHSRGGEGSDFGIDIAIDTKGNTYVTGGITDK